MRNYYLELTAGIFVLAGLFCLGYLSVTLGGVQLGAGEGYTVSARFSNVGGLRAGSPVTIAGVEVGRVKDVSLDEYAAQVEMNIGSEVKLPRDSIASIQTEGLIGQRYVSISPGGAPENIEPDGKIRQTEPAIDLRSLISKYAFGDMEQ